MLLNITCEEVISVPTGSSIWSTTWRCRMLSLRTDMITDLEQQLLELQG
jgi:hypothetical protein